MIAIVLGRIIFLLTLFVFVDTCCADPHLTLATFRANVTPQIGDGPCQAEVEWALRKVLKR